ncbi:MAG: DUF1028 domain-containing protein [Acidobacteriota bacterium]
MPRLACSTVSFRALASLCVLFSLLVLGAASSAAASDAHVAEVGEEAAVAPEAAQAALASTQVPADESHAWREPTRPVATYSIVARDAATGQLGVAVQSHWFQVGTVVSWAEAGVGAVATQSFSLPAYGPRGLALMRGGVAAPSALERLVADDEQRAVRQVAMVDADGRVDAWTGDGCIEAAGHLVDAEHGFAVQANLMDSPTVWQAMADAYRSAEGDLAERMLIALEAAEAEGGDIRGRQSAALLVVRAETTGEPWRDRLVDLRVDDAPEPLVELRRLLRRHRAYEEMNAGDEALAEDDLAAALGHYSNAAALEPTIDELPFWQAVTLVDAGRVEEALPIFEDVFARDERWLRLVPRLVDAGLLPDDAQVIGEVLAQRPGG